MSSNERMIDYHISRLKDKRASIRIDSINQLALLNAVTALDVLREVFENDPDVEVRKAAQSAGREIYSKRNDTEP